MAKGRKQDTTPNKVFTGVVTRTEQGAMMNLQLNDKDGNRTNKPYLIVVRGGVPRFVEVKTEAEAEAPTNAKSKGRKAVA